MDGVVCSGSSRLPNPGFGLLASPSMVCPASGVSSPLRPSAFTDVWAFQQLEAFSKGGISVTRLLQFATTFVVQTAFLKKDACGGNLCWSI